VGNFDLIIIGGGAGGFGAAIRANELGAKTALINFGLPLGGTCVNVGCVPSKTLLYAGEVLHLTRNHGVPGIELEIRNCDFRKIVQDEIALVESLRNEKYRKVLHGLKHIRLYEGKASFISKNDVNVNGRKLHADKFIIATGSTANVPTIEGIHQVGFMTHIEALKVEKQPEQLIVIGAGPLGLEFAQMYSHLDTRVAILEFLPSILPSSESVLVNRLSQILKREGITVRTNVVVKKAWMENGRKMLSYISKGKKEHVSGDEILLAAGKTPNTKGLGLENIEVQIDKKQAIIVNKFLQTSQSHIFAVGDVNNLPLRLETTAGHEGTLAAENALSGYQKFIDYTTVPYTIFTDPQLAGVGFTEDEMMKEMKICECRTISFADVPRALITKRTEGLIKMVIHPETRQIHGVHIIGPHAGELTASAMMLIRNKNTIDDVIDSLPMFPTLSEAIKLVALSFTKDISKLSCCI